MIWNQKPRGDPHRYYGGAEDLVGLFEKYDMDPVATMQNSLECWQAHNGEMHEPEPFEQMGKNAGDLPQCFFAAPVHKGTYNSKGRGINLDADWKWQQKELKEVREALIAKGMKGDENTLWPL